MPSQLIAVREALADLTVPTPGGDVLTWGDVLNDDSLQKLLNMVHGVAPVAGAAAATDADGNPTPDTTTFPPANYPLGTIFKATSYPAGVDDGGMEFRREGGAGAEVWVWRWGSFRASNSNGDYVRDADGKQECWHSNLALAHSSATGLIGTWTYPAAFSVAPVLPPPNLVVVSGFSFTDVTLMRVDTITATSGRAVANDKNGGFVSTDTGECDVSATGEWKA